MKKKINLSLKDLKVKSFATELNPETTQKIRAGIYTVEFHSCDTYEPEGCIYDTEWPRFC